MPSLLISLPEIAALAKVQRPVVSMWRTRFATGDSAFPPPVHSTGGRDQFNALEVARWLDETKHGNNPEAVADLAAFAAPSGWNDADPSHIAALSALIALRAFDSLPISAGDLTARARTADPTDVFLSDEVASRDRAIDWASFVDSFIDAAYSPQGAWERLEARALVESRVGAAGPLDTALAGVLAKLVLALGGPEQLTILDAPGELAVHELIAATALGAGEGRDLTVHLPDDASARQMRRHLVVLGLAHVMSEDQAIPETPAVQVARLRGRDAVSELAALEELIVDLSVAQHAVVLGPVSLLVDNLSGAAEQSRDAMLRSGRVRAIGRLGYGWIPTAARLPLAFWVIGEAQHDVPIADRFAVVGNLSDVDLTLARMDDVIGDVLAGLGGMPTAKRHSFRYFRAVRTSGLLAGGSLISSITGGSRPAITAANGGAQQVDAGQVDTESLPALIDAALSGLGPSAPDITLHPVQGREGISKQPPTTIERAISARELRVLSGVRLRAGDCLASDGFTVLGQAELRDPAPSVRRIDRLRLLADYPRVELTQPGDVVFLAGATPRAIVDVEGSSVVEYPARVLRVRSDALAPELLAADIALKQANSNWRDWTLRRIAAERKPGLSAAIAEIEAEREAAKRRLEHLERLEQLVLQAVATNVVHAEPDSFTHDKHTTEGAA